MLKVQRAYAYPKIKEKPLYYSGYGLMSPDRHNTQFVRQIMTDSNDQRSCGRRQDPVVFVGLEPQISSLIFGIFPWITRDLKP